MLLLALSIVAAIFFLLYFAGQLFWARIVPNSAAIIYTNLAAVFAALGAGWAWRMPRTPRWRRISMALILAGVALALRALGRVLGRRVAAGEIVMAAGEKPRLATPVTTATAPPAEAHAGDAALAGDSPDFSVSHSGPWVGCAALALGRIGLDIEMGSEACIADWVVREALLKATGAGLRAAAEVRGLALHDGGVRWQGELWHVRRLDQFPGACACVLSSRALSVVDAHVVQLTELFAS